ncbi:MAG: AAA family ATPase [Candidatus Eremiobacteraeota bacterium]|nr:AAA family ATPase [Candidatus Eremiobacteraeota bacterium]
MFDSAASLQVFCRPFIGRGRELTALVELRRRATRGQGAMVLIGGEAGIGKSRLLRELAASSAASRMHAFTIGCLPFAQAPFYAVTEALRVLHARMPEVARRNPTAFSGLTGLVPELTEAVEPSAPMARAHSLRALARALTLYARHRAVCLVFEDVHWADEETLDALQFLARELTGAKLLAVVTYRTEATEKGPLVATLARLARFATVHRLELTALTLPLMRRLARATLEGVSASLPQSAVAAVIARSEGNPLFAEELLRSALSSAGSTAASELPLTIRGLVAERLATFSEADAALLARASVLGRRFSAEFLGRLSGRETSAVLTSLRRARDAQLVIELDDAGTFAFRHALIREAIGANLLAVDARALHAEVVAALEEGPAAEPAELAFHAWASGDRARTLRYNEGYGDAAAGVRAYGEAAAAYQRALAATGDAERRFALNLKLGDAASAGGYPERARAALETALAERPPIDDATYERVFVSLQGQLLNAHVDPRPLIERESRRVSNPSPAIARLFRNSRALAALYRGHFDEALALTEPLDLAGDLQLFSSHALARVTALAGLCERERWHAEVNLWILGSERFSSPLRRANALMNGALQACILAEGDRAAELLPEAAEVIGALKTPSYLTLVQSFHAYEHFLRGRLLRARELVDLALDTEHEAFFGSVHAAMAAISIGVAVQDQELLDRVDRNALQRGLEGALLPSYAFVAGPYAYELAAYGRPREAAAMLAGVAEKLNSSFGCVLTAMAIAELADLEVAARSRAIFARDAERPGDWVMQAVLPLFDALVAARNGDVPLSQERALIAADKLGRLQYPLLQARALELAGASDRALDLYLACGDLRNAGRLHVGSDSSTGGGDGPTVTTGVRDDRRVGLTSLSPREREIGMLVAVGASNREIAATLSISERTVEKHLHTAFEKLGVRSRTQLAVLASSRPHP